MARVGSQLLDPLQKLGVGVELASIPIQESPQHRSPFEHMCKVRIRLRVLAFSEGRACGCEHFLDDSPSLVECLKCFAHWVRRFLSLQLCLDMLHRGPPFGAPDEVVVNASDEYCFCGALERLALFDTRLKLSCCEVCLVYGRGNAQHALAERSFRMVARLGAACIVVLPGVLESLEVPPEKQALWNERPQRGLSWSLSCGMDQLRPVQAGLARFPIRSVEFEFYHLIFRRRLEEL